MDGVLLVLVVGGVVRDSVILEDVSNIKRERAKL